jgi:hypothetical protein
MAISRHTFKSKIGSSTKTIFATNKCSSQIHRAIISRSLAFDSYIMQEGERLDVISLRRYENPDYWWIIAAASGIGWPLQLPAGTILAIPRDLNQVFSYVG